MPIKVERYDCGICGERYDKFESALECENKGRVENILPPGTAYEDGLHGPGILLVIKSAHPDGHEVGYAIWGFRDTPAGDNGPKEIERQYGKNPRNQFAGMCGGTGPSIPPRRAQRALVNTPRYRRARAALKKLGIKIRPWRA